MLRLSLWSACVVMFVGCTDVNKTQTDTTVDDSPADHDLDCSPGSDGGSGSGEEAVCLDRAPTGDLIWSHQLASGYTFGIGDLVVDINDAAISTRPGPDLNNVPFGVTKIDANGTTVYSRPFGGAVATDAAGYVYVAGVFNAPIDFGLGLMTPSALGSVFIAKLDAQGNTVWVREVRTQVEGTQVDYFVSSLAVSADGSTLAVSSWLNTTVLTSEGRIVYRLPYHGKIALDASSNLVVTGFETIQRDFGSFFGSFIVKVSPTGCELWRKSIDLARGDDVAIDAEGNVIAIGEMGATTVFGEAFVPDENLHGDIPLANGGYIVKLSPDGDLIWKHLYPSVEILMGVETDPLGAVLVTGAQFINFGGYNTAFLDKFDVDGQLLWTKSGVLGNVQSFGVAVGADSCGNVLWEANAFIPNVDTPAYVIKLAL